MEEKLQAKGYEYETARTQFYKYPQSCSKLNTMGTSGTDAVEFSGEEEEEYYEFEHLPALLEDEVRVNIYVYIIIVINIIVLSLAYINQA